MDLSTDKENSPRDKSGGLVMEHLVIRDQDAAKIAGWLQARRCLAVWNSIDLSDPGFQMFTPGFTEDGKPYPKPHWKLANSPARVIDNFDEIVVSRDKEIRRFHVAVRVSGNGLMLKCTDASSRKIREAITKAGEGSYNIFDYSMQQAVIMAPDGAMVPLSKWMEAQT